jgi:signal transduction histidine kinase
MKPEEAQELANALKDSANNVFHLMENLLEWARMQRGLIEFQPVTVPLLGVIKRSVNSLSDQARHKNQTITVEIPEDIYVNVDLSMLESTLRNLLSNAIKFSYRDGQIRISARVHAGTNIEITITDHGFGMSPGLLETLFKIDSRSGRIGTEGEPSTGLGLLLCREFIEKNGGTLSAESIEGEGSTFRFTLPLVPDTFRSHN